MVTWAPIRSTCFCGTIRTLSRCWPTTMRVEISKLLTPLTSLSCVSCLIWYFWPFLVKYELSFTLRSKKGNHYLAYLFRDKIILIRMKEAEGKTQRKALILNFASTMPEVNSQNSDVFVDHVYKVVIISLNFSSQKKSKLFTWSFNNIFKLFRRSRNSSACLSSRSN